ncbi:MAG: hypothetical protein ACXWAT_00860 [Methylobacter sp.]
MTDTAEIGAVEKPLPAKIRLEQDATYWIKTVNQAEFTRQFYAGNIITDAQIIAEIVERGFVFEEI